MTGTAVALDGMAIALSSSIPDSKGVLQAFRDDTTTPNARYSRCF